MRQLCSGASSTTAAQQHNGILAAAAATRWGTRTPHVLVLLTKDSTVAVSEAASLQSVAVRPIPRYSSTALLLLHSSFPPSPSSSSVSPLNASQPNGAICDVDEQCLPPPPRAPRRRRSERSDNGWHYKLVKTCCCLVTGSYAYK
ncbi:hypothetical protein E2C01_081821 [Portunus trituberculatus]|uniref:Uncharacterized protein n=1 Tax=Portunus trituberculatus TaxID=210409 RepID=A0A5B7IZ52_PORTR|nr:hypothetical protein [Portunus trituberculatus]